MCILHPIAMSGVESLILHDPGLRRRLCHAFYSGHQNTGGRWYGGRLVLSTDWSAMMLAFLYMKWAGCARVCSYIHDVICVFMEWIGIASVVYGTE